MPGLGLGNLELVVSGVEGPYFLWWKQTEETLQSWAHTWKTLHPKLPVVNFSTVMTESAT
ncbi:hypothetical protein PROFUN_04527 [Planoprotostelium fungivorum]|uniref:Uncharacterized protein n=1 Tax=Planoprotostelium fungivorum TaxID=1890364 RepID=A0A2P6NBG1_9EUKA|nr:hypothetical protein PROFUN_04527 [Planoprotostelium fungivorum]